MTYIAFAGVVFVGLLVWFHHLEANERRHTIFGVLVLTLLVESIVAGRSAGVPVGILRPRFMGQDFRLPDLVIMAGLAARLLSGRPSRYGTIGLVWLNFLVIFALGIAIGFLNELPTGQVLFQGKFLFYVAGGIVLGAGMCVSRAAESIGTVARVLAVCVIAGLGLHLLDIQFRLSTPVQRLNAFGVLSNDTVTVLVVFGAVVLLVESVRDRPRGVVMGSGAVLLLAPIAGDQRASYLVLGFVAIATAILMLGATWRRRVSITGVQIALSGAFVVGVLAVGFLVTDAPGVIIAPVEDTFTGIGNQQSADARLSLADEAFAQIRLNPILGSGVGATVTSESPSAQEQTTAAAHNLVLDLWMRIGLVGLMAFVLAVAVTIWVGVGVWRRAVSNEAAAFAVGGVIVICGIITKAMVEPAFDKYRLSLSVGLAVGCVIASWRTDDEERSSDVEVGTFGSMGRV